MSIKEKLESLGRNSIQLKIARKETYKLGATPLWREAGCAAGLRLAHL